MTDRIASPRLLKSIGKIAIDVGIGVLALWGAGLLRFGGDIPPDLLTAIALAAPLTATVRAFVNYAFGMYRQIWYYTSATEVLVLAFGTAVTTLALIMLAAMRIIDLPPSILAIDGLIYLVGTLGIRMLRRIQWMYAPTYLRPRNAQNAVRTLLVGAGDTANALLTDVAHRDTGWRVVAALDDDPAKAGARLRGVPIVGPTTQLRSAISSLQIGHVVIAMPSASKSMLRHLINAAQSCGATVRCVRPNPDVLGGGAVSYRKDVTIADLADAKEVKHTLLDRARSKDTRPGILVTGGAGYIGSHLVRALLEQGNRVRVLDNFLYGRSGLNSVRQHPNLEIVEGDISSIRDVVGAVKDVKSVIALAAIVGDPACGLNAEETLNLNYESTKVLVEACNFYDVERLVFASSCSVYGASDTSLLTEQSPLNPVSLYARTRILSEEIIFDRCGDVVPVVLRLATVFGLSPRMRFDLVVNTLTARAVVDGRIQIVGGNQWRPFVHCKDVARAFLLAAIAPAELVQGEIFNVGTTALNYTISQVGEIVASEVGDVQIDMSDDIDDPRNYRVSFDKIADALDFRADCDLRSGIREMVSALRQSPRLREYNDVIYSNLRQLSSRLAINGHEYGNGLVVTQSGT